MEYHILNEILTCTVGGLFQKASPVQQGLRDVSSWINKPQPQQQQQQQQQQIIRTQNPIRHEKKRSSGEIGSTSGSLYPKEEPSLFTSIDSGPSIQKSVEYSHIKSRSIDNSFDKKSMGSFVSLNTSTTSIQQPSKSEFEGKMNYSNISSNSSSNNNNNNNHHQNFRQNISSTKSEPPTVEKWIKKDGPLKLQESLANLNLDIRSVNKVNLSAFSHDQLQNEKKSVKNELKNYDAAFTATFRRQPEREEKEPMRPLYIYYKKIKQYLVRNTEKTHGQRPSSASTSGSISSQNHLGHHGSSSISINSSENGSRTMKTNKSLLPEKENKTFGGHGAAGGLFEKKLETSFEVQMSRDRGASRLAEDRFDFEEKNSRQPNQRGHGGSKYNGLSQEQIVRQLDDLKNVRQYLREKLHVYQTEFTRNNNRRIKYHRDIAPVEDEYKRYKDIKHEIHQLENMLITCTEL